MMGRCVELLEYNHYLLRWTHTFISMHVEVPTANEMSAAYPYRSSLKLKEVMEEGQ
jgi:hypothetical protein